MRKLKTFEEYLAATCAEPGPTFTLNDGSTTDSKKSPTQTISEFITEGIDRVENVKIPV